MRTPSIQRIVLAALIALASSPLAGCAEQAGGADAVNNTESERTRIVATTGMVADIARAVAGDRAEVDVLIGAGLDPHLYKPTRTDVQRLLDADAIFYNGLLLEGKLTDALTRAEGAGKPAVAVAERIDPETLIELEGEPDPHVWMDPEAWSQTIDVVRASLAEIDPDGASVYETNAAEYQRRLEELDAYAIETLGSVPESQRVLVTAHDAFNYFGRKYGFEVVGIQGISTESEAGVLDIERLVNLLVERSIAAVFVESTVSERNVAALIAGAESRGHTVAIGGELFSDAMGEFGSYEGTYIGMIDHNATTIARALGGDAPSGGMQDRLAR
ncbi:MAG: zinc ABC transporter substrate-binding protein [Planctomycetota bacterium]